MENLGKLQVIPSSNHSTLGADPQTAEQIEKGRQEKMVSLAQMHNMSLDDLKSLTEQRTGKPTDDEFAAVISGGVNGKQIHIEMRRGYPENGKQKEEFSAKVGLRDVSPSVAQALFYRFSSIIHQRDNEINQHAFDRLDDSMELENLATMLGNQKLARSILDRGIEGLT